MAFRLSRARPEALGDVRRDFECPACSAKRHPPKPRLPAALPRTFRCILVLDQIAQTVAKCVAERWIQFFLVFHVDHCRSRKRVCGDSVQRIHERKEHLPCTLEKWPDRTTR